MKANAVIFFFLKRNTDLYDKPGPNDNPDLERESISGANTGIHFMVIEYIHVLREKILKREPLLLENEILVYILSNFDNMK